MAEKRYTVTSPVRYKGTLYAPGADVGIDDANYQALAHCLATSQEAAPLDPPPADAPPADAPPEPTEGQGDDDATKGGKAKAAGK